GEQSDLPGQPTIVVDTVGAGDSFAAVLVIGLLRGQPPAKINALGNRVAAFVSSQTGAPPPTPPPMRQPEERGRFAIVRRTPRDGLHVQMLRNVKLTRGPHGRASLSIPCFQ